MIPKVTLLLVLGSLAAAMIVGAAAEGGLEALPPQPYFPSDLARPRTIDCSADGVSAAVTPEGRTQTQPVVDRFRADWYGRQLRAAREYSLSQLPRGAALPISSVRFTWLRSFDAPVIVRVDEGSPGALRLTAKMLSGHGGYAPGKIATSLTRRLSAPEAAAYLKARGRLAGIAPIGCAGGADGAEWIVETRGSGRYSFVRRWTPTSGAVRDLGLLLLGFTGWKVDPVY